MLVRVVIAMVVIYMFTTWDANAGILDLDAKCTYQPHKTYKLKTSQVLYPCKSPHTFYMEASGKCLRFAGFDRPYRNSNSFKFSTCRNYAVPYSYGRGKNIIIQVENWKIRITDFNTSEEWVQFQIIGVNEEVVVEY